MRLAEALLVFAVVVCVSLAEDVNTPVGVETGVKEIENAHVQMIPRVKRSGNDDSVEFKIKVDEDNHYKNCRHSRRHYSKESCSDEDKVQIKLDIVEDDKSCSDGRRRHRNRYYKRRHSKESCSDEDDTVEIKVDVESKDESCSDSSRRYSKESGSDENDTLKIKVDVDKDDKSCSDESRGQMHRHRHSHSNTPQIHYHHHNFPSHVAGSSESGDRYQSSEKSREHHRDYQPQNKYGEHVRKTYESEESGYRNQGGSYGKRHGEPMVCESEDTITILV